MPIFLVRDPLARTCSELDAPVVGFLNAFALSVAFWSITASAVMLLVD